MRDEVMRLTKGLIPPITVKQEVIEDIERMYPSKNNEKISPKNDKQIKEDRAKSYGSVSESFGRISKLWSAYLGHDIKPHEVAIMMTLLKISRTTTAKGETLVDSYQDGRIYLELAEELNCCQ